MNNIEKLSPPFPRLGEIYRALAVAFDTKSGNRDVDRLAREGDFDWSLIPTLAKEILVDPLAKNIDIDFACMVADSLEHFRVNYVKLVSTFSLDSMSRDEALPVLVAHCFAPQALGLICGVKKGFGGPDLPRLFDPDFNPIAVVLEWLDQGETQPLARVAYPDPTTADRAEYERIRKWKNGADLPDRQSIVLFSKLLSQKGSIHAEKLQNLRVWLLIARALSHLEKESPIPFRGIMLRQVLLGSQETDIVRILMKAAAESQQRYSALSRPALQLHENLKRTALKEHGDLEKTRTELDAYERLTSRVDPEGRLRFHVEWLRGRWHVLAGEFASAMTYYEGAAELANYRAGDQQKKIVEEALALAAHLGEKPILKRLKHRAVSFNLFIAPRANVVEDWEIDDFKQHFYRLFPVRARFTETAPDESFSNFFPFLAFSEEEISHIKPNLTKLDRVLRINCIDGQVRRLPQLHFFVSFNHLTQVELLLSKGAPVDQLDDAGGSALLCAIQLAMHNSDRRILDCLLVCPHSKATLNSITIKKQHTPLLCALEMGDPDLAGKLLGMGADPNLRGNIVDESPLYSAVTKIGFVRNPKMLSQYLHHKLSSSPDAQQREVLRRYNIKIAGVFGDGPSLSRLREIPWYEKTFQSLVAEMQQEVIQKYSESKLIQIVDCLLHAGAKPNAPHAYPAPARTPLMLAAENNSVLAFDLMMRHDGDPFQRDAQGMDCVKIALSFSSYDVVRYMRSKGIT